METRNEFITIVGRANAGKSSLLNLLTGEKIAAVSSKPQTTRTRISGIVTEGNTQYVFMDTPGVHRSKNKLGEHMNKTVKDSITDVDLILMVSDVTAKIDDNELNIIKSFRKGDKVILLLNKIDLLKEKEMLVPKIAEYSRAAKTAKDAAAGAVLVTAVFAVIVAVILFLDFDVIKEIIEYFSENIPQLIGLALSVPVSVAFIAKFGSKTDSKIGRKTGRKTERNKYGDKK